MAHDMTAHPPPGQHDPSSFSVHTGTQRPARKLISARRTLMSVATKAVIQAAEAEEEAEEAIRLAKTDREVAEAFAMLQDAETMAAEAESLMGQAETMQYRQQKRRSPLGLSSSSRTDSGSTQKSFGDTPKPERLHPLTGSTPRRTASFGLQPLSASQLNASARFRAHTADAPGNPQAARRIRCISDPDTSSHRSHTSIGFPGSKDNDIREEEEAVAACGPAAPAESSTGDKSSTAANLVGSAQEPRVAIQQQQRAKCGAISVSIDAEGSGPAGTRRTASQPPCQSTARQRSASEMYISTSNTTRPTPIVSEKNTEATRLDGAELAVEMTRLADGLEKQIVPAAALALLVATRPDCSLSTPQVLDVLHSVGITFSAASLAQILAELGIEREQVNLETLLDGLRFARAASGEVWQCSLCSKKNDSRLGQCAVCGRSSDHEVDTRPTRRVLRHEAAVQLQALFRGYRIRRPQPATVTGGREPFEVATGARWSSDQVGEDWNELHAAMKRLEKTMTAEAQDQDQDESLDQELHNTSPSSDEEMPRATEIDASTMEQARRESMAAQQEASRLADEAEAAQHRTMNQSVIAEEAANLSVALTEEARRLSIEAREAAVLRSKAEAADARAAAKAAKAAELEAVKKRAEAAKEEAQRLQAAREEAAEAERAAVEAAQRAKERAADAAKRLQEQQARRVAELQKNKREAQQVALDKQKLISRLDAQHCAKLDCKAGPSHRRNFVDVLQAFGITVDGDRGDTAVVAKAYRKALIAFHPDRASRRGADWQAVVESEEVYKLLQNEYAAWEARKGKAAACARPCNPASAAPPAPWDAPRPHPPRAPAQAGASAGFRQYSTGNGNGDARAEQKSGNAMWRCSVCTKMNGPAAPSCKVCGRARGYINSGDQQRQQASADSARNRWASVQQKARDDAERIRADQRARTTHDSERGRHSGRENASTSTPAQAQDSAGAPTRGWRRFFRKH